jgi:hypothetical protein
LKSEHRSRKKPFVINRQRPRRLWSSAEKTGLAPLVVRTLFEVLLSAKRNGISAASVEQSADLYREVGECFYDQCGVSLGAAARARKNV